MGRAFWVLVVLLAATACSVEVRSSSAPTVTATVTVTAAPGRSPTYGSGLTLPPVPPSSGPAVVPTPARLRLTVFGDGCGVIRSEGRPGAYQALTWVFRDSDGFQVLGRNAEGETRYRYYRPGTYTVVLEAFGADHYVPVSNTVTVHC